MSIFFVQPTCFVILINDMYCKMQEQIVKKKKTKKKAEIKHK